MIRKAMMGLAVVWLAGAALGDVPILTEIIPGGTFTMGCDTNLFPEGIGTGEVPAHPVTMRSFMMGKYEVTKAQWDYVAAWAETNGYDITTNSAAGKGPDHPVQTVTWYSAVKWCNARNEMKAWSPCYFIGMTPYRTGVATPDLVLTNHGYRLPTEAEWEYAARGGSATNRFPWRDSNEIQHSRANYDSSAVYAYDTSPTRGYNPAYTNPPTPYTAPVGSFATNGYSLCDLAGNVWEWCWDWNGFYSSDPATNPVGPGSGSARIVRGGSWQNVAEMARVTARHSIAPNWGLDYYGFRVVYSYTEPSLVRLADFALRTENGQVMVCWQTAAEIETLGFDVLREEAGAWVKVNTTMVPALGWPQGGAGASYCVADPGANVTDTFRYKLVEHETTGGTREYGPFEQSAWTPRVTSVSVTPAGMVIQWPSRDLETYHVFRAAGLDAIYEPVAAGLPATPPVNAWTDPVESARGFYRIEAR